MRYAHFIDLLDWSSQRFPRWPYTAVISLLSIRLLILTTRALCKELVDLSHLNMARINHTCLNRSARLTITAFKLCDGNAFHSFSQCIPH